jgi:predicted nucleic acid-binding protein
VHSHTRSEKESTSSTSSTSGWIEYFFGGPNAAHFAHPIEQTKTLVVPVVCLYEVFKKINQVAEEARALQAIAQMQQGCVVPLTEEIALRAVLISLKHKLPMADSLVYATGLTERAIIWTQDEHFRGLPGVKYWDARTKVSGHRPKGRG